MKINRNSIQVFLFNLLYGNGLCSQCLYSYCSQIVHLLGMEIVKGLKEDSLIYFSEDHYAFLVNKTKEAKVYLRCRDGCGVSIVYDSENNTVTQRKEHFHTPDLILKQKLQFRDFLKSEASRTNRKFQDIFLEGERLFPDAAKATGGLDQYRSMLYRSRGIQFAGAPVDLQTLDEALQLEANKRCISIYIFKNGWY